MTDPAHDGAEQRPDGVEADMTPAGPDGVDAPRTEPGSDLPGAVPDDLAQVAAEVDAAMAGAEQEARTASGAEGADPLAAALGLAEQRLGDLQRERAEFVNYRRRVERDREVAGLEGRTSVLTALLPVLDDIDGARTHGDLVGPFAAVADKLDAVLRRTGLEPFGEVGDPFDPALHEALLHDGDTQVDQPTCTQVLQRGYRIGDRVLRPARVAVASPQ
ncbi:nucleotide exchange factor GrpE [Jannaschia sp. R86511]|uniref:nucleotide exchange factor GrpE n=1 Tax=Jannaschia sp. R86511 TaxID=3093853 RepID=UPI0036D236C0